MSVIVDPKVMQAIENGAGYGFNGYTGGIRKQRYWTPDGRMIIAIPNIREFVTKDNNGRVVDQGIRDANLDKGWVQQKTQVLKLFCQTCDRWHDTQAEVDECKAVETAKIVKFETQAKTERIKEQQDKDLRIEALEGQIAELTAMVKKFMEKK